jgi:hypothetical protein
LFGSLILVTTYILSPLEIVVTGNHQELDSSAFAPIIANHQVYTNLIRFIPIGGTFGFSVGSEDLTE